MGGCSFEQVAVGNDHLGLYKKLCQEATQQYGTDGYNGTISTTNECVRKIVPADTTTRKYITDRMMVMEKGICECVRLSPAEANNWRKNNRGAGNGRVWVFYGIACS